MGKQKPHRRTSTKGKRFPAGRGKPKGRGAASNTSKVLSHQKREMEEQLGKQKQEAKEEFRRSEVEVQYGGATATKKAESPERAKKG